MKRTDKSKKEVIQNESFDNLDLELQIMEKELIGLLISSSYPQVATAIKKKKSKNLIKSINKNEKK